MSDQLGELLRDTIRYEQTTDEALAAFDAFTQAIPTNSGVAALDCAESAVRLRGITSSTRNYMLFSRELIDVAPDYSQRVQSESGGRGD